MLNYVEVAPLFCSVVYVGFSAVLSFCVLPVSRLCVSPLAVYALVLRPAPLASNRQASKEKELGC